MKYERLVEIYVHNDLRHEIKTLKKDLTYDEFLRNLIKNSAIKPSPSIEPLKETLQKEGTFDC